MRRDAYGSRVLVPRSQCADDAEEDDFDDDDAAYDDADGTTTRALRRQHAVERWSSDDDEETAAAAAARSPYRKFPFFPPVAPLMPLLSGMGSLTFLKRAFRSSFIGVADSPNGITPAGVPRRRPQRRQLALEGAPRGVAVPA